MPVIHDVLTHDGIVEPFLALPNLDLERRDDRGRTLLLAACETSGEGSSFRSDDPLEEDLSSTTQKEYIVDRLCQMGAELSVDDEVGNNPLHLIAVPGNSKASARKMLPFLIERCPALVHQQNHSKETPLQIAAKSHEWDSMQALLDSSADPFAPDAEGNTLLHHIAGSLTWFSELWTTFDKLLGLGLDINARNNKGETPVFEYARNQFIGPPLRESKSFARLIATGADLLVQNYDGGSLLHVLVGLKLPTIRSFEDGRATNKLKAVYWDEKQVREIDDPSFFTDSFAYLIELGLDPTQEDTKQRTPVVCSFVKFLTGHSLLTSHRILLLRMGRMSFWSWSRDSFVFRAFIICVILVPFHGQNMTRVSSHIFRSVSLYSLVFMLQAVSVVPGLVV